MSDISEKPDKEDEMDNSGIHCHMVLYYDRSAGVPQIGLITLIGTDFVFVPNEAIQDFSEEMGEPDVCGMADFVGQIPQVLAN